MTFSKFKLLTLTFFAALFMFQGCIPSLHPLYSENTTIRVDEIIGTWGDPDSDDNKLMLTTSADEEGMYDTWSFEKDGDKSYRLIQIDGEGEKAAFQVHFVKLGDDIFADFYPDYLEKNVPEGQVLRSEMYPSIPKMNDLLLFHTTPVHTFAKIEMTDEHLNIRMFNYDWIQKLFEKNRIRLKHEEVQNHDGTSIILTASTEELQKFVTKYADEPEAFTEGSSLARKI